jgi:hypothetical protein
VRASVVSVWHTVPGPLERWYQLFTLQLPPTTPLSVQNFSHISDGEIILFLPCIRLLSDHLHSLGASEIRNRPRKFAKTPSATV